MDFIADIFFEVFLEIFVETFIALCQFFVPDKKISEKDEKIIKIFAVFVSSAILIGFVIGIVMLFETHARSICGWILTGMGIVYMIVGIVLAVVKEVKKKKK